MVLIDPESSPSDPAPAEITSHLAPTGEKPFSEQYGRLMALAIAVALIAGVASLLAGDGEWGHPRMPFP